MGIARPSLYAAFGNKESPFRQARAEVGPAGWEAPRTPWGAPDLRGIWPLDSVGQTPTQRPEGLGETAYVTEEQYQAALQEALETAQDYDREDEEGTIGSGHWLEWGQPLRQTSLIMEPADGAYGEYLSFVLRKPSVARWSKGTGTLSSR